MTDTGPPVFQAGVWRGTIRIAVSSERMSTCGRRSLSAASCSSAPRSCFGAGMCRAAQRTTNGRYRHASNAGGKFRSNSIAASRVETGRDALQQLNQFYTYQPYRKMSGEAGTSYTVKPRRNVSTADLPSRYAGRLTTCRISPINWDRPDSHFRADQVPFDKRR